MIDVFPGNLTKMTDFAGHGLGTLDPEIQDPKIHWEMNGEYSLSFTYPLHGLHAETLVLKRIIRVRAEREENLFRIKNVTQTLDSLKVFAEQIATDLLDNFIEDIFIENQTGDDAIEHIAKNMVGPNPFRLFSDIPVVASARIERQNVYQAILDIRTPNNFINRWGGEIYRKNFEVGMYQKLGQDHGVEVRYGKNLTGFECDMDESEVATVIRPVGYEGLALPEKYVESPHVDPGHPIIREIKYDDIKAIDETKGERQPDDDAVPKGVAYELLRKRAAEEFSLHHMDEPKATFKISFQELSHTEEYKDLKQLETLGQGDDVKIVTPGHTLSARCIAYDYNPMADEYESMTLGNFLTSMTGSVQVAVDRAISDVVRPEISYEIHKAANGKNVVVTSDKEPVGNFIDGDIWYKPIGSGEYEMRIYKDGAWPIDPNVSTAEDKIGKEVNALSEESEKKFDNLINGFPDMVDGVLDKKTPEEVARLIKKGDVLTIINQEAGSIIFGAKNSAGKNMIQITPETTYIENSTIKDAMIEKVSASKLTSGIIDAAIIHVIHIDADNITSGRMSAIRIRTGILEDQKGNISWNLDTGEMHAKNLSINTPNFQLDKYGRMTAANATLDGKITASDEDNKIEMTYGRIRVYKRNKQIGSLVGTNIHKFSDTTGTAIGGYRFVGFYDGDEPGNEITADDDDDCEMPFFYNKVYFNGFVGGRLHATRDLDMHNHKILNAKFENGVNGTLRFVEIHGVDSDGTVSSWTRNCYMRFKNGVLVDASF